MRFLYFSLIILVICPAMSTFACAMFAGYLKREEMLSFFLATYVVYAFLFLSMLASDPLTSL